MAIGKNNVVQVEHVFAAPAARVFGALSEGRLFLNCGAWSTTSQNDFRVGGKYRFDWGHKGSNYGEYLEIVVNKRVVFTWNSDEMKVKSQVTIELIQEGERCKLKLRHEGFENLEIAEAHDEGWAGGLADFDAEVTKRRVFISREFLAPVEMVFDACSGLAFFSELGATAAKSKVDFRVGGRYSCQLENGHEVRGEFKEIVRNKKIVMSWDSAPCGVALEGTTTVSMEFGPWGDDGKNSYLELTHEGFTQDEQVRAHHEGWSLVVRKIYDRSRR